MFIYQLDSALKRLHTEENNRQTTRLPDCVIGSHRAMEMLRLLGFHFQAKGTSLTSPYVVYPHWNMDELLIPSYDALRAILGIAVDQKAKYLKQSMCFIKIKSPA